MEILTEYLRAKTPDQIDPKMIAFIANLNLVNGALPQIAQSIVSELADQRSNLKLIASENYCSLQVQSAMCSLLTDKYAEGKIAHRFYTGCGNIDDIEKIACDEACDLFGCEHAYVQPHSGADANLVAYWAILRKRIQTPIIEKLPNQDLLSISKEEWDSLRHEMGNQKLLAMDLYSGGHLTHGYRHNASGLMFDVYNYQVDKETGLLNYDEIHKMLLDIKPLIFLVRLRQSVHRRKGFH